MMNFNFFLNFDHKQNRHPANAFRVMILLGLACWSFACSHHRGPADVDDYIQSLERSGRDEYQKPDEVIHALEIVPGMVVADIGAGSGYFTRRFSGAVGPAGAVMAVDVDADMLAYNRDHISDLGTPSPVDFILATPHDPSLPVASVDLIFLCNVYHHLDDAIPYLKKSGVALKPGGRVAVIDFYHDDRSGKLSFSKHHLVARERVMSDFQKAGYTFLKEHTFLPRQYFLEFSLP